MSNVCIDEDKYFVISQFFKFHRVRSLAGLMRDDTIIEDADVKEALRRLPERVYNDRMFRIKRALDLSMKQQILPKEQWTKYEEVGCVGGQELWV